MQAELSPELAHDRHPTTTHRTLLRVVSPYEDDLPVFVSRGRWRRRVVVGSTWSAVVALTSLLGGFALRLFIG